MKSFRLLFLVLVAGCAVSHAPAVEFGVSLPLATQRAAQFSAVRYDLRFNVPESRNEPVTGTVTVGFTSATAGAPVVLDFRGDSNSIGKATVNGTTSTVTATSGHIVVPGRHIIRGANTVSLSFTAANEALNRDNDFMYALFVPDRASTAFPSFDQPDLKARYRVTLEIPRAWQALANGALANADTIGNRVTMHFAETEPLATYQMSFAAGRFRIEQAVRNGRTLTMYHRETDSAKVARNRDQIFDLHAAALRWLEQYTGIRYPYGKFAFLAVPAFQFGGMEHPGAIWYRAGSLFLDESATQSQYLARANLISHETAHMWFGNLVTMRWFNDVWMKEVFANFMGGKIAEPSFPAINHSLRFFLANHPTAYAIDRTAGANPIRQDLENLRQAGSLYGGIIYQKAPIVMRQLEQLVGDSVFREGLREYMARYQFGNATWPDLIDILDKRSPQDLASFSRAWVEEAGRPTVTATWNVGRITLHQADANTKRNLHWQQRIGVAIGYADTVIQTSISLASDSAFATLPRSDRPRWILAGADGVSYANFVLDSSSQRALLTATPALTNAIHRAVAYNALYESMLNGTLPATSLIALTLRAFPDEREELVSQQMLGLLRTSYWRFLGDSTRRAIAPQIESTLWSALDRADGVSRKGAIWSTITSITLTSDGISHLQRIWQTREAPAGLPLSEQQYTSLAEDLAIRNVPDTDRMLDTELKRITNPDRRARFVFIRPSLSANTSVRDSVFDSFRHADNRRRESWVLDAVRLLNHPLRAQHAEQYVQPGLALLPEIQQTGDIFFPLGWLNALLDGHQSVTAASTVQKFLAEHSTMEPRLRGKLLQAADDLFRSARIVNGWQASRAR